jgi:hypothetical protein
MAAHSTGTKKKKRTRGAGAQAGSLARLGMQLSIEDYDAIERAAGKEEISMSQWVRIAVKKALAEPARDR